MKEGHLLKKSSHWKSCDWSSKYVCLSRDGALTYYPSYSGYLDETGAKSIELRTATVKLFVDDTCDEKILAGKILFEVRTLDQQRWIFSCKSEEDRASWMTSIKAEIKNSLQVCKSSHIMKMPQTRHITLQGTEQAGLVSLVLDPGLGNTRCVDCGAPGPEWVSLNLGVVMCITCSAAHRAMGSHVSQVQ